MGGLTLAGTAAAALLSVVGFLYAAWRRALRPAWRGMRWFAGTVEDLRSTDVGSLGVTVADTHRKLTEIRADLAELGRAATLQSLQSQRADDRVAALAHDVTSQLGYVSVTLDGFDVRLSSLESHPALQKAG